MSINQELLSLSFFFIEYNSNRTRRKPKTIFRSKRFKLDLCEKSHNAFITHWETVSVKTATELSKNELRTKDIFTYANIRYHYKNDKYHHI